MNVVALLAASMVALVKPDTNEGKLRLETIATAIADEAAQVSFWPGEEGTLATGLMLVAIGYHESKFQEKTRRCKPRAGKYIGLYQILPGPNTKPHSVADVCASDVLQARLALRVLKRARERCPQCSPVYALRAYTSGNGALNTREAREITDLWSRAAVFVGLQIFPFSRQEPRLAKR